MIRAPYMLAGFAGTIAACLMMGSQIHELNEENAELTRKNSSLINQSLSTDSHSSLHQRTRSLREKRPRYIAVNYSFLEQGLQISLPDLYGTYIDQLDLSAYENRYFESLLVERLIAQQQFGLEMITGDSSERLASTQTITRRITENDTKIRSFLNHPEDYADFVRYEKQLPERRSLGEIRPLLSDLTDETEEKLIDLLYQCRVKAEGEQPIWATIIPLEDLEEKLDSWQRCDESIARTLPSILPENQIQDFLKHWKFVRDNQRRKYDLNHALLHGKS